MTPPIHFLSDLLACKEASRLISQLQDRAPTRWERLRLRWHLAACDACTRFERQIALLRESMRRYRGQDGSRASDPHNG